MTNDRLGLARLADLTVTKVRQRVAREQLGHRGRKDDLAWAHRMLLLRAGDRLSARVLRRLDHVDAPGRDDPTGDIGAAWGVKERLRQHQAHRPRLPQPRPLPGPYPAPQCPPIPAAFTLESAGHHVQLRIARKARRPGMKEYVIMHDGFAAGRPARPSRA
ncbi:hypothetical protein ACFFHJ_35260 [Planotetraspora thailandica]|uniref:hypothetical protein n=1 Tax=Planotetraspora thailandica TaxID=487172 RepID=UPI001951559F|nr:hypothetical protein [Planotetraspora thailandica]